MKMVALIPARAGSKRIPGKNTKMLAGRPLIEYTIAAAQESGVFERVCIATDIELDAVHYDGRTFIHRRAAAADDQPDIMWVREALQAHGPFEAFAILRPTSPFRTAATIRRAYERFQTQEVHSMRAVQLVKEHPGKMWQSGGVGYPIVPLITQSWPSPIKGGQNFKAPETLPWHSRPTQTLPTVYVQNASLEMAWSWVIPAFGTISGNKVAPFFTEGYEGFDLNTMDDWREAERLIAEGLVDLPSSLARV